MRLLIIVIALTFRKDEVLGTGKHKNCIAMRFLIHCMFQLSPAMLQNLLQDFLQDFGLKKGGSRDDAISQITELVLFKEHFPKEFRSIKKCGGRQIIPHVCNVSISAKFSIGTSLVLRSACVMVTASMSMWETLGLIFRQIQSVTMLPTSRHCCDLSLNLCCPMSRCQTAEPTTRYTLRRR